MKLDTARIQEIVRSALAEDLGEEGDLTTRICVPSDVVGQARIEAREPGVVAGMEVAVACFRALDAGVRVVTAVDDGDRIAAGQCVLAVRGTAAALLGAERTALNLLQRACGIATRTRAFVDAVAGTGVRIFDTRKTTPGLRALEKYAVTVGGGHNHRFGLFDQVLIKENHFTLAGGPREDIVARAVAGSSAPVVAEARDLEEAREAVRGGAAVVLLDNFAPGAPLRAAVQAIRMEAARLGRRVEIEASGGVRLENVRAFAECGVDRISVGALTHSVPALDLSMLIEEGGPA